MHVANELTTEISRKDQVSLWGKFSLICGSTFTITGVFGIGLMMPIIKASFSNSPQAALVPWIAALVGPAFVLSLPAVGYAINRFGYGNVYIVSILIFTVAGVAPLFCNDLRIILPLRLVLGAAVAGAVTASQDGIGRLPPLTRSRLFGLQTSVGSLFAILVFPAIGYLARFGWHPPFAIYLLGLAILPFVLTLPRAARRTASEDEHREGKPAARVFLGQTLILFLLGGTVGLNHVYGVGLFANLP